MTGSFSEEALKAYQEALAEQAGTDFVEGDSYDFTTCIRPNGSTYGTRGKCRKGTEGAAKPGERSPRKFSAAQREEIAKRGAKSAKRLKGSKPAEPPAKKPEKSVAERAMEMVMANAKARGLVEIKRSDPAQKPADVQQGPRPAPKGGPMGNYDIPGANAGGMFRRAYND